MEIPEMAEWVEAAHLEPDELEEFGGRVLARYASGPLSGGAAWHAACADQSMTMPRFLAITLLLLAAAFAAVDANPAAARVLSIRSFDLFHRSGAASSRFWGSLSLKRNTHEGGGDSPTGFDGAAQVAGHLGDAPKPSAVGDRQLQDPQTRARRSHLHL